MNENELYNAEAHESSEWAKYRRDAKFAHESFLKWRNADVRLERVRSRLSRRKRSRK